MHRPSLILLVALAVVTITEVSAEYIWTGTEWKWQDPDSSDSVGLNGIQTPEDSETKILDTGSGDGHSWDDETTTTTTTKETTTNVPGTDQGNKTSGYGSENIIPY